MGTRFTAYGIKTNSIIGFDMPRPVGMNNLLYVGDLAPAPREVLKMVAVAEARKFNFIAIFCEEKAVIIKVIGAPLFNKPFEISKESL